MVERAVCVSDGPQGAVRSATVKLDLHHDLRLSQLNGWLTRAFQTQRCRVSAGAERAAVNSCHNFVVEKEVSRSLMVRALCPQPSSPCDLMGPKVRLGQAFRVKWTTNVCSQPASQ